MDYSLQIQKILVKVEGLELPDDKIKLLKEAINLADAHNDIEWGFDLRLEVMEEEFYTPHDNESFAAFAWLLDACDQHPDLFDEDELLWKYKWMVGYARGNADISLEQIETITNDFKVRLERNGYSLRPYYGQKHCLALFHLNDVQQAKQLLDLRDKAERDDIADCYACELDDRVALELAMGNVDVALTIGADLFNGKLMCAHVPFITYCTFVDYYHKAGNIEQAFEFFVKAENELLEMENDSSQIGNIGKLIAFLSIQNKDKAWEYFEKYIQWSLECDESSRFDISKDVLPLLKSGGTYTMQVNPQMSWYRTDGNYNLQDLYDYYYNAAHNMAQRFDARNRNSYFTSQLNERA